MEQVILYHNAQTTDNEEGLYTVPKCTGGAALRRLVKGMSVARPVIVSFTLNSSVEFCSISISKHRDTEAQRIV